MTEKLYCGIGRERSGKYGPFLSMSFSRKDVELLMAHLDNGWVRVSVNRRKESKGDITHSAHIDTWTPDRQPYPQDDGNQDRGEMPF